MRYFFIGRNMNNNRKTIIATFVIITVLIVTIITAYSAILPQAIEQAQAQTLNVTEQKAFITDTLNIGDIITLSDPESKAFE
jgi:hypothetical protein